MRLQFVLPADSVVGWLMGRSEILFVNCEDVSEDCKAVVVWERCKLLLNTVG